MTAGPRLFVGVPPANVGFPYRFSDGPGRERSAEPKFAAGENARIRNATLPAIRPVGLFARAGGDAGLGPLVVEIGKRLRALVFVQLGFALEEILLEW